MRTSLKTIGFFILALALGYLGYSTYIYHNAYVRQSVLLHRLQTNILSAPMWRYGTITAVEPEGPSIQVTLGSGLSIRILIADETYVGRQDLQTEGGVHVGVLPPVPITLSDLAPGQNFATLIHKDAQGRFTTSLLLVGNPL